MKSFFLHYSNFDSYRHLLAKEKNNSKSLHASKILNKQLKHKVDNFLYKWIKERYSFFIFFFPIEDAYLF